jgi:hypothetical protein
MNSLGKLTELSAIQEKVQDKVKEYEPKLSEATTTVNTVVSITQINVEQTIHAVGDEKEKVYGLLSGKQREVLDRLYSTAKDMAKEILSLNSIDHAMKIGRLMAEIVKLMEKASYQGEKIPGAEKKEIALELGKRLLSDSSVVSDETLRNGLLTAYDLVGEQMLDTLIDVSRHVNTAIKEVAVSCCEALIKMLKK